MISNNFAASLLATASLLSSTLASPIFTPNVVPASAGATAPQLAVYWGQGPGQKRLADFCADTTMDIIPIGFVNVFPDQAGGPGNNYGNACGSDLWVSPDGQQTQMLTTCSQIAEDIITCQNAGKKILASLGGATPGGNFLASTTSAVAFADFLWGSYGPVQDPTLTLFPRPFGNAIVDGFDLDIESGADSFYSDLVNELRVKFATDSKQYYISAAPQCIVPDAHLDEAIQNSLIDYLFIQYYNTDSCSAASLFSTGTLNTNTDVTFGWLQWLKDNSQNPNIKIFLGLPGSIAAAHPQDYLDITKAQSLIEEYACSEPYSSMFGGVMLFDATYSDTNTDVDLNGQSYAFNVKEIFGQLSCNKPPQTTTTSTTTTTTTTSTTTTTTTTTTTSPTTTTTTTTSPSSTTTVAAPTSTATTTTTTTSPSSTTTVAAPTLSSTSTTTSVYVHGTTTSSTTSAPTTAATSTTTSSWSVPVGGVTTSSSFSHPIGGETTSSSSSTTTTYSHPIGSETTTSSSSSATTYSHPVGGETTSSSSSPVASTTTTSYSWADWTSSSSKPVEAATTSSVTTSSFLWADWTSSSSKPVEAATTSSATSSFDWTDWESSSTSTKPVAAATTTSSYVWADWTSSSSSSKPVDPVSTSSSFDWTDWETTASTASTSPIATAGMTLSVVPVKPTGTAAVGHPSGSVSGYTGPSFAVSTAVKPTATSVAAASSPAAWTYSQSWPSTLTAVAAATATPASTGWLAQSNTAVAAASASSSSVAPLNVTPFTGAAARQELPGAVLSVAVCVAFAVVGLFL